MPLYGVAQAGGNQTSPGLNLTDVSPGDTFILFNAETLTAPQASVAFNRGFGPGMSDQGTTFQIKFAATPVTGTLAIQGSNVDIDGSYETLYTSTNVQYDSYTDTGRWRFYRAKLLTQSAGGAVTVIAQR